MSGLNIHRISGQVGHKIKHFRCNDVVKPLLRPPHPLLNILKEAEAVNFIKNSHVPGNVYSLVSPCGLE